jgi:hypothetical protein
MLIAAIIFLALALVGHVAFWIGLINRTHGTGLPRLAVKGISLLLYLVMAAIALMALWQTFWPVVEAAGLQVVLSKLHEVRPPGWVATYAVLAAACGAMQTAMWGLARWQQRRLPHGIERRSERMVDVCQTLGGPPTTSPRTQLFCRLPFNQLWQLQVVEFDLLLPELPAELEGLSIGHLSDLHFSPRIERSYFDEVVRLTNALQVDVVALTGDICDKAHRIDWVQHTLGKLEARLAKLYVLGNHDLRTRDVQRLRQPLASSTWGDRWKRSAKAGSWWPATNAPGFLTRPRGSTACQTSR